MILFSILAVVMVLSIGFSYLLKGEFGPIDLHLAAYGFILAGLGVIIDMFKKREQDLDVKIGYMLNKKFIAFSEELKTIRTMLLKMDEKRDNSLEKKLVPGQPVSNGLTETADRIEYTIPPKNK
jgi:hypothetical protein